MTLFFSILIIHLVALMSPGPDFFFVTQTAVSRSRGEALAGAIGIALGATVWAGLALMGLQLIFERLAWLHQALMVAGGLYLLWMGYNLLKSALRKPINGAALAASAVQGSKIRSFLFGLMTNLSNAKAMIYFSSIFTMLLTPDLTNGMRVLIFVSISLETLLWFMLVALVFGLPRPRSIYQRSSRWIDGLAGGLFGAFGLALLWEAR